jgi:hypothetical protein
LTSNPFLNFPSKIFDAECLVEVRQSVFGHQCSAETATLIEEVIRKLRGFGCRLSADLFASALTLTDRKSLWEFLHSEKCPYDRAVYAIAVALKKSQKTLAMRFLQEKGYDTSPLDPREVAAAIKQAFPPRRLVID